MLSTLLIANRGEIACRIARTARAMGITTIAVYSDADTDAPHVRAADAAVRLPGVTAADTYLRADLIVAAAVAAGADAVHPGYGFLSEDAAFAQACADVGLVFVGPPPSAIAAMGDKVRAKAHMQSVGVPVLPGVGFDDDASDDAVVAAGSTIGFPLLVKAAFGGGGRGMRIVRAPDEIVAAVRSAQREAAAAFGDGTVFCERYVEAPRHIEIQVIADRHGTVVPLFERECSIQRRHQKVIEEAPSTAVDPDLRRRLCSASVDAVRSIGYEGAGTVEFVLDSDGSFFFLEVNTRLQVEHPVTELVTGLDLVRLQLDIASGLPLGPEVIEAEMRGHAIEARLYAEDVPTGFVPASGPIHTFEFDSAVGVRIDAGYDAGSVVSTYYDAMLAKVIAWAPTRSAAAQALAHALDTMRCHGVVTNRALLVSTLRHPEFLAGHTDTGFLERHDPVVLGTDPTSSESHGLHALAAVMHAACVHAASQAVRVPIGFRTVGQALQHRRMAHGDAEFDIGYRQERDGRWRSEIDGIPVPLDGVECTDDTVVLTVDHRRIRCSVHRVGESVYVDSVLGRSDLRTVARFVEPDAGIAIGSLRSPLPGTVVRVAVEPGASVDVGDELVALEAMKMEHSVRALHGGIVAAVHVVAGDHVDAGTVLAVVEPHEEA